MGIIIRPGTSLGSMDQEVQKKIKGARSYIASTAIQIESARIHFSDENYCPISIV